MRITRTRSTILNPSDTRIADPAMQAGDIFVATADYAGGGRYTGRHGVTLLPSVAIFGDKSDGNQTISGALTPQRDYFYDTLTLVAGCVLDVSGAHWVHCDTLDLSNAPAGAIVGRKNNGGNASGVTVGAAGTSLPGTGRNGSSAGVAGSLGGTANGVAGLTNTQVANVTGSAGGIPGGPAGAGGNAGANTGGAGGVVTNTAGDRIRRYYEKIWSFGPGGAMGSGKNGPSGGGGAGDGTLGGAGGAGGIGGAGVGIIARKIICGSNATASIITAIGGNGGNGGDPAAGNRAGGGGGTGGGGGDIYIVTDGITGSIANALEVTGGNGGNGGNKTGTGLDGNGGYSGTGGRVVIINLQTGVITVYDGQVSALGVAPSGRLGGTASSALVTLA